GVERLLDHRALLVAQLQGLLVLGDGDLVRLERLAVRLGVLRGGRDRQQQQRAGGAGDQSFHDGSPAFVGPTAEPALEFHGDSMPPQSYPCVLAAIRGAPLGFAWVSAGIWRVRWPGSATIFIAKAATAPGSRKPRWRPRPIAHSAARATSSPTAARTARSSSSRKAPPSPCWLSPILAAASPPTGGCGALPSAARRRLISRPSAPESQHRLRLGKHV